MKLSTEKKIAVGAFVSSLVFSLVVFSFISEWQNANIDPDRFGELAVSISEGNGYAYVPGGTPVFERAPLYTFLLASIFTLTGGLSLIAVQILQAVFHSIASLIVYSIGSRIFTSRTAQIGQGIFAFHPLVVWYTSRMWVETTHTLALVIVVLSVMRLVESPSPTRAIITGIVIGLSCLIKPMLILFSVAVVAIIVVMYHGPKRWIAASAVLLASLIVIVPWTYRNYLASHELVIVNTSLGFNLIQGDVIAEEWPFSRKSIIEFWQDGKQRTDSLLSDSGATWESVKGDKMLISSALDDYIAEPAHFARKLAANFFTFWYLSESPSKSIFFGVLQLALLICALVSYIRLNTIQKRKLIPVTSLVFYYVVVNVSIVGWARYSMPLIPFLAIMAAPLFDRFSIVKERYGRNNNR